MFGFGKKSKALKVLKNEFDLDKSQIFEPVLDLFLSNEVNEYDVAISYIIAQAFAVRPGNKKIEEDFTYRLLISEFLSKDAVQSEKLKKQARVALEHRKEKFDAWYLTFDLWLVAFKAKCGEINNVLVVDSEGKSFIDFMMHDGLRKAHGDRVDPEFLAAQFAPTFHPDTFNR